MIFKTTLLKSINLWQLPFNPPTDTLPINVLLFDGIHQTGGPHCSKVHVVTGSFAFFYSDVFCIQIPCENLRVLYDIYQICWVFFGSHKSSLHWTLTTHPPNSSQYMTASISPWFSPSYSFTCNCTLLRTPFLSICYFTKIVSLLYHTCANSR